jgi:Rod binding domain-containing protein
MPDAIALNLTTPPPEIKRTADLKEAAGKFESLLIAQMLKSARETDSGGWSGDADQSSSSMMDMAEQNLADLMGSQGALGIARMVVSELGKKE